MVVREEEGKKKGRGREEEVEEGVKGEVEKGRGCEIKRL